ncbi:MAG: carbohydrate ABC transporter permease [Candidatus Bathyarchaeia archaeon]
MRSLKKIVILVSSALLIMYVLFPIYWIFVTSIKWYRDIVVPNPSIIPLNPTLDNYERLFGRDYTFQMYVTNSLLVGSGVVLITLLCSSLAGYGLARLKFKNRNTVSNLLLLAYVTPPAVLLIPFFAIISWLGLINTLYSLLIVYPVFTIPFSTWLLKSFFEELPVEVEEAAMIDGAGIFKIFRYIAIPLAAPALAVVIAYSLVFSWTEYMFAFTFIRSEELKTVPVALAHSITVYHVDWGLLTAGAVIGILPVLLLFIPIARYMIKGLALGGRKG